MKSFVKLLFAAFVIFALNACEYETIVPAKITKTNLSFSQDIQPIFTANCIACHGSITPKLEDGVAYNNLDTGNYLSPNDESCLLYQKLLGSMKSHTTETERQYILQWIKEGAKNN